MASMQNPDYKTFYVNWTTGSCDSSFGLQENSMSTTKHVAKYWVSCKSIKQLLQGDLVVSLHLCLQLT